MFTQWWLLQLKSRNVKIRIEAAKKLGHLKKVRATKALSAALNDGSRYFDGDRFWEVAAMAAWALGEIGDARAVEPLIKAFRANSLDLRKAVDQALKKIGTLATDALIVALKDHDDHVREGAAQVLGDIKDPRALNPLITALGETGSQYGFVARRFEQTACSLL